MVALSWLTCFQDLQWQRLHKPQCLPVLYFSDAANFDLHNSRVLSLEAKPIIGESARNLLFLVGEIIAGLEWMCATAAAHLSISAREGDRDRFIFCVVQRLSRLAFHLRRREGAGHGLQRPSMAFHSPFLFVRATRE